MRHTSITSEQPALSERACGSAHMHTLRWQPGVCDVNVRDRGPAAWLVRAHVLGMRCARLATLTHYEYLVFLSLLGSPGAGTLHVCGSLQKPRHTMVPVLLAPRVIQVGTCSRDCSRLGTR